MFHPATLLLIWAGCALLLPRYSLAALVPATVLALVSALAYATARTATLLRRARWLLLTIAVLFAVATPGLLAPPPLDRLGITVDGLVLAGEHLARLLILLTTLAILHEHLGSRGLVAGLHWLLAPLFSWPGLRERIVVRLMLVIDFVEGGGGGWKSWLGDADIGPTSLALEVRPARWFDWAALLCVTGGVVAL